MIQDGARLRYMVPLALQNVGMLERVFIDWFVRRGSLEEKIAGMGSKFNPKLGKRMAERSCAELDPSRVIRSPLRALRLKLGMRRLPSAEDAYIWHSHETAKWVLKKGFGQANAVYGFVRNAAPEIFQKARSAGLRTCGDQMIAPLEVELAEMKRQIERWPGFRDRESVQMHQGYLDFERATWQHLDRITCASDYVREGLISVGIPAERIGVIPYPWPQGAASGLERKKVGKEVRPLLVGFVGAVGLRKGRRGSWRRRGDSSRSGCASRWWGQIFLIPPGSRNFRVACSLSDRCPIARFFSGSIGSTFSSFLRRVKAPPPRCSRR